MTQEMLFSKYAEQYPLTVPQEAVENELQLLILEEKQRIQYETLTGFAVHLSPQEELNKKMEELQAEALRRAKEMLVLREIMAAQTFPVTPEELEDAGIHENTIRLSIGTEHIDDIIADLEKGFAAVK